MRKLLFAAALAGTAIGGVAIAGQAGPGAGGGMMRADTDGDGRISRAEFLARADARFARLDTTIYAPLCLALGLGVLIISLNH